MKTTAEIIVGFGGGDDSYQQNKFTCAFLLTKDHCNEWVYMTQWKSGTCLFVNPSGNQYVTVNPRTEKLNFSIA